MNELTQIHRQRTCVSVFQHTRQSDGVVVTEIQVRHVQSHRQVGLNVNGRLLITAAVRVHVGPLFRTLRATNEFHFRLKEFKLCTFRSIVSPADYRWRAQQNQNNKRCHIYANLNQSVTKLLSRVRFIDAECWTDFSFVYLIKWQTLIRSSLYFQLDHYFSAREPSGTFKR